MGEKQVREIKALLRDPDIQISEVAHRYGISRTTLYKYAEVIKHCEKTSQKCAKTSMNLIQNTGTQLIIDLMRPPLRNDNRLDCITPLRAFKLDTSNLSPWNPKPGVLKARLFDHQDNQLAASSEADVLYELLFKRGLDLCAPIEKRNVEGLDVHAIGGGELIVCLAEKITREQVESLSQGIIAWHKELAPAGNVTCVFRNSAFADGRAKTDMVTILHQHGIANMRSL
jgi:hypothetical protein